MIFAGYTYHVAIVLTNTILSLWIDDVLIGEAGVPDSDIGARSNQPIYVSDPWHDHPAMIDVANFKYHDLDQCTFPPTAVPSPAPSLTPMPTAFHCEGFMTQHLMDDEWTAVVQNQIIGYIDTAENFRVEFDMRVDESIDFGTSWHGVLSIGATNRSVLRARLRLLARDALASLSRVSHAQHPASACNDPPGPVHTPIAPNRNHVHYHQ